MHYNRRILIVDDHAPIHDDFRKILGPSQNPGASELDALEAAIFAAPAGTSSSPTHVVANPTYAIDSAYQPNTALDLVMAANQEGRPYALVFMDVRMPPHDDGIATTRRLWAIAPQTEVVLCSAYSDYSWEQIVATLGTSDRLLFLRKPYDAMEVRQLALALTTKWSLGEAARNLIGNLESEVAKRTAELEIERAKRVEASRLASLGEMAAGIAHEINNPLAIIKGSATLLGDYFQNPSLFDSAKARNLTTRIESTVSRIAKIVKGLLDFSRSGEADPFATTSVAQVVSGTLDFCTVRLEKASIALSTPEIPESLTIECRSVQISQVLVNLISNAFDAVEPLAERWVRIEVADCGEHIELAVVDSGMGIPDGIRDKILYPFFTTKELGKGTGLGLSISKGIAEQHNGTLLYDVESPRTRFVVRLPKVQPNKEASSAA